MNLPKETCSNIIRVVMQGAIDTIGPNVTFADLRLLQVIARGQVENELLGVTDVAEALSLPLSTASRMIAQLGDFEANGKGYITQVEHPNDRRRVVLKMTSSGKKMRDRHLNYVSRKISPMIDKLR